MTFTTGIMALKYRLVTSDACVRRICFFRWAMESGVISKWSCGPLKPPLWWSLLVWLKCPYVLFTLLLYTNSDEGTDATQAVCRRWWQVHLVGIRTMAQKNSSDTSWLFRRWSDLIFLMPTVGCTGTMFGWLQLFEFIFDVEWYLLLAVWTGYVALPRSVPVAYTMASQSAWYEWNTSCAGSRSLL